MTFPIKSFAPLVFVLLVLGCSSRDNQGVAGRQKTYRVQGVVTYNGNPVEEATVVFNSPTENRAASATTDAQGRFNLTTFEPGDGAVAGKHQVLITKIRVDRGPPRDPESTPPPPKEISLLPAKYGKFQTSGLSADVTASGENRIEFKLTD